MKSASTARREAAAPAPPAANAPEPVAPAAEVLLPLGAAPPAERPSWWTRAARTLVGRPRDLADKTIFHTLSLIPFLAWVGLGADGLSSSSYGPEEAFRSLGQHTYLAVALAAATAATIFIISAAYSRIIEHFPHGGGYVVATKLLGPQAGVVSGAALVIDYVLTITVSVAAAGDALFSFLPAGWAAAKLPVEAALLLGLTTLNIRGVRESVLALTPVFVLFLVTHALMLGGALLGSPTRWVETAQGAAGGFQSGLATLGAGGLALLFLHAYSLGGGTYTGIEAVSNGLAIMREPRVRTARRTMVYMAVSLAIVAAGLLLGYLVLGITPQPGKTMNAVLAERLAAGVPGGQVFVVLALLSEGALLLVAAQSGFIGGPRVLANMAVDSWVPRRLAALSDRLTTQNGIVLMGGASLLALLYSRGDVHHLVVMYSINVFATFSLSMFGMLRRLKHSTEPDRRRQRLLFGGGFLLCATILAVTVAEKFRDGGWLTLVVTGGVVALCFLIRRHYNTVTAKLVKLDRSLSDLPSAPGACERRLDPRAPTAVVMVTSFGGLGIHTVLNVFRAFPGYFKNLLFVSVGVVDSGEFKGEEELAALRARTDEQLAKYVEFAERMGVPARALAAIGTDAVQEAEALCLRAAREFPRTTFFAGQVLFHRERWYDRWLHNQTAYAVQKRLQWQGMTMVILPVRVR